MAFSPPLLITGGSVAFLDDALTVRERSSVAIVDGLIDAVGPDDELAGRYPDAERLHVPGKLVMPGLINLHTHLYSELARGLIADIEPSSSFTEILEHLWWRLDRALTDEDIRLSAAAGAIDLIRNGTTTIVDHHASQVHIDGSLSAIADALSEAGLRSNLCFEVTDRDGPVAREAGLKENERFAKAVQAGGSLVGASVGLHASFTLEDATLERAGGLARDLGVGCHIHVAEDIADVEDSLGRSGKRVVERLQSFDVLGARTIAAHCIHIDDSERSILEETSTLVAHNPQSNMNNAVGCADVPGMLAAGVLVGLGTDGFTASLFDEMKVANLIHRHQAGDPGVGHDIATTLGLKNNSLAASRLFGRAIGKLETGAAGDVIVLDYDPPTPLVTGNFGGHLIFGLTGWMVETVVVGGRILMKDRELTTLDEQATLAQARERALDLWARL